LVRTSLNFLKNDGLLVSDEKKIKKEDINNRALNYQMRNNNFTQHYAKNPDYLYYLEKKIKLLGSKLKSNLENSKMQKYRCRQCKDEYTEDKYAHYNHRCIHCGIILEKMSLHFDEKIKSHSEIIMKEVFNRFEGCKNEYSFQRTARMHDSQKGNNEKGGNSGFSSNPLLRIHFDLNNYELAEKLKNISPKNEEQFKAFKELVMIHTGGNIAPV